MATNNNIQTIYIYPQIFVYTKAYVDAALANPSAEPDIENFGTWVGMNDSYKCVAYEMNPLNIPEGIKPLIIASSVPPSQTNIGINITFNSIVTHFIRGTPGAAYVYDTSTSINYQVVEIDGVDYVIPSNPNANNIPLHVRFMYYVTYLDGSETYAAIFPSTANSYYETVLNASGLWKFTPDTTSDYTGYQKCGWSIYDENGALMDGVVTGDFTSGFAAEVNSSVFYPVFSLSLRGGKTSASVLQYSANKFGMNSAIAGYFDGRESIISGTALDTLLSTQWKLSDLAGAKEISFTIHPCYRLTYSWKKHIGFEFYGEFDSVFNVLYYDESIREHNVGYNIDISTDVELPTILGNHDFSLHKDSPINYAGIQYNNNTGNSVSLSTVTWKILKYALKQGTSELAAQWGSAITPSGGITLESNVAVTLGSLTSKTIYMNYDNLDDLLYQATITPSAGNTIYAGVFLCQGTLNYTISGGTESASVKFIIRSGMASGNNFTLESATNSINSSNQWTSSTFEIRMKETHLDDMQNSKNTFGNLILESVSLYYISPRLNNSILLFAGWNSMTDFNELSISNIGTQKKLTFTSLTQGANPIVVSGTADFNSTFYDDYYNELLLTKSSMSVSATARYTISQTPEGSEIDNTNEGTISVVS